MYDWGLYLLRRAWEWDVKILFLDIDGVLNRYTTKEKCADTLYRGIAPDLGKLFREWALQHPTVTVILSSTWRKHPAMIACIGFNNIPFSGITEFTGTRGDQIKGWLYKKDVSHYAIVDDVDDFLPEQKKFWVQTGETHGLTKKHLRRIEKILELT